MDQTPLKLSVEFTVAQELLFLIAGFVFRDSNFKQLLVNSGLAEMRGIGGIQLIDEMSTTFIKNFQNIVKSALEIVRNQTRLGIVLLETESVLQDKDIEWLRSQGVDVEVFTAEN